MVKSFAEPVRWRSPPSDSIAWVSWGEDCVAFHRPSGMTHFLNRSRNEEERQGHFEEIQSMLERLEDVGLIDRA